MAAEPATTEEAGTLSDESSFPTVRVDLQASTFLDPLPFDQAFLIVGRVPASTGVVEIRLSEFLEAPVTLSEQELQRFESKLTAYLAAGGQRPTSHGLRRKANALLIEQAQSEGALRQVWHYAPPWNWGNWGNLLRDRRHAIVAPGTIFDLSEGGESTQELEARLSTTPSLAGAIAQEARSAQVVPFSPSRTPRLPVRWNRLGQVGGRLEGEGASGPESSGSWNRLERIRALTRVPDEELFSGAGRGQQVAGDLAGWRPFKALIQPLEAESYYRFEFHLERRLTEAEVDGFVAGARRRAAGVLARADRGALRQPDGQRLRTALTESLEGVVDCDRFRAPGTIFDREAPYGSVNAELSRVAGDWAEAAEGREADELLQARLSDLARRQHLVHDTSIGASTADNDYVSGDIGLLYASRIGETAAYIGANFHLRPVNKSVPLRQKGGLRRFAFTVGLTLNSIEDKRGIRSDLYFNQALVLGAGFRVSQYWRISGGGLVFRERDPDSYPLTRRRRTALTPYVAVAFDVDTGQQLKGIGGLFDFLRGDR